MITNLLLQQYQPDKRWYLEVLGVFFVDCCRFFCRWTRFWRQAFLDQTQSAGFAAEDGHMCAQQGLACPVVVFRASMWLARLLCFYLLVSSVAQRCPFCFFFFCKGSPLSSTNKNSLCPCFPTEIQGFWWFSRRIFSHHSFPKNRSPFPQGFGCFPERFGSLGKIPGDCDPTWWFGLGAPNHQQEGS